MIGLCPLYYLFSVGAVRIENAVEYVGSKYLTCLVSNKKTTNGAGVHLIMNAMGCASR
jgi:hypothetical protein